MGALLDAAEEVAAREAALSAGALSEASALLEEAVAASIDSVPAQARACGSPSRQGALRPTAHDLRSQPLLHTVTGARAPADDQDAALVLAGRLHGQRTRADEPHQGAALYLALWPYSLWLELSHYCPVLPPHCPSLPLTATSLPLYCPYCRPTAPLLPPHCTLTAALPLTAASLPLTAASLPLTAPSLPLTAPYCPLTVPLLPPHSPLTAALPLTAASLPLRCAPCRSSMAPALCSATSSTATRSARRRLGLGLGLGLAGGQ